MGTWSVRSMNQGKLVIVKQEMTRVNRDKQYHSNGKKWRETKKPLDEGQEENENTGLKLNIRKAKIMASSLIISWHRRGNSGSSDRSYFLGLPSHCRRWLQPWNEHSCSLESYEKLRQRIKNQGHHFAGKGPYSQSYGLSNSHVWMWELDYKEGWALKNWSFQTVVFEKTLENPLDCKEIQPVHPKGNQS